MLLTEASIIGLDTETTGLDVWADRVIEVASSQWTGGRLLWVISTVICPDIAIPVEASKINGITNAKTAGAPRLKSIMGSDSPMFPVCDAFLAHHATYDRTMLVHDGLRQGAARTTLCRLVATPWLDTRLLARALDDAPAGAKGYSLQDMCKRMDIDPGEAHRGEDDVRSMWAVFERMRPHLPSTLEGCLALQASYAAKGRGER